MSKEQLEVLSQAYNRIAKKVYDGLEEPTTVESHLSQLIGFRKALKCMGLGVTFEDSRFHVVEREIVATLVISDTHWEMD